VVVLGGATATVLKGRGSLQDIDQQSLAAPLFKWQGRARRVRELVPVVEEAFWRARAGVPGPVFVECPVDLLYPEVLVREWYGVTRDLAQPSIAQRLERAYLSLHLARVFASRRSEAPTPPSTPEPPPADAWAVARAARALARAERPVLVLGSQSTLVPDEIPTLVAAIEHLGLPVWLSGMARGLLGASHPLQFRHQRKQAIREADLVVLAGTPCDFRLDYGRQIGRRTTLASINRDAADLKKNRRPDLGLLAAPDRVLQALAGMAGTPPARQDWFDALRARECARDEDIAGRAAQPVTPINPIALCQALDAHLGDTSIVVADGGDFVATASYVVRPRAPLSWLDPGCSARSALAAASSSARTPLAPARRSGSIYGDGALGFSLAEFDTLARQPP
jgi:thiamine pyrophosphate-dependent acetolactate synthase large subunit-like protein